MDPGISDYKTKQRNYSKLNKAKTQDNEPDVHPAVISYQLIVNRYCVLIFPAALFDLSDLSDLSDR